MVSTPPHRFPFGHERGITRGPWLVRHVVQWLHRDGFIVDRADVSRYDRKQIAGPKQQGKPRSSGSSVSGPVASTSVRPMRTSKPSSDLIGVALDRLGQRN